MMNKILIVESDPNMQFLHRSFLENINPSLEIHTTSRAEDIESVIEECKVDVVVCRYELGLDQPTGIEILRTLATRGKSNPFILILSSGREIALKALQEGAISYVEFNNRNPKLFYRELNQFVCKALESVSENELHLTTQSRFNAVYQNLAVGIAMLDKDSCLIDNNETTRSIIGLSNEEMNGHDFESLMKEDTLTMNTQLEKTGSSTILKSLVPNEEGLVHWVRITLAEVENNTIDNVALIAVLEDLTNIKTLQITSEDLKKVILLMHEHSNISRHLVSQKGVIEEVSDKWLVDMGYTKDDVVGKQFVSFINESNEKIINDLKISIESNHEMDSVILTFRRENGTLIDYITSSSRIRNNTGEAKKSCFISHPVGDS